MLFILTIKVRINNTLKISSKALCHLFRLAQLGNERICTCITTIVHGCCDCGVKVASPGPGVSGLRALRRVGPACHAELGMFLLHSLTL